jgi:hypothetical protein
MVVRRAPIFRYTKSGKLAAIIRPGSHVGYSVLQLSPDMRGIADFRIQQFVRRQTLSTTEYQIEVDETITKVDRNKSHFSYRMIRVLSPEDIDQHRWRNSDSLDDLPVSPEPSLTHEERLWAGERAGNLGKGIGLAIATIVPGGLALVEPLEGGGSILAMIVAGVSGFFLLRHPWRKYEPPNPVRIRALENHKAQLRLRRKSAVTFARTQLDKALGDFRNWQSLAPHVFERELSLRLENEGYQVKVTRPSKDGGVDIEAVDGSGRPVIVQAKKYAGNVGVSVVREMIGIRETRTDRPQAIIYALAGFTKGAKFLAAQSGGVLRDIRSELLPDDHSK